VKNDNNQIKDCDKRIRKLRKLIEGYKKDVKDISSSLNDKGGEDT